MSSKLLTCPINPRLRMVFVAVSSIGLCVLSVLAASPSDAQSKGYSPSEAISVEQAKALQQDRQKFLSDFQRRMETASTNEQRQIAVDEFRAAQEKQDLPIVAEPVTDSLVLIERMKTSAAGNTDKVAEVARLEKILQEGDAEKTLLTQINEAQGLRKQQLVDEFRASREIKLQERQVELAKVTRDSADVNEETEAVSRSPELDARLMKIKTRQQEYDAMMLAVDKASSPSVKAQLIDAWRAKAEAEMVARQSELKHLEVP